MIPKRIVLDNFLSFGSPATEITFTDDEPLWVLGGPNGVGKSAVFDAMTYALYAEHRGGATDHASLVRHGANGFRVLFEFEFNGVPYQITRNRPLKGRPTQGIKQWSDGGWNKSVQLPMAAGRQDQVKLWTERTLGLPFDAFTASVLLRQGQADEIITATGAKRLAILKKIIGAERYEALSNRVHEAARIRKKKHEDLRTEMDQLTRDGQRAPTDADVQAARAALTKADKEREAAHERGREAAGRVKDAERWAALQESRNRLQGQLRDADGRAARAERIRNDKSRLEDLTTSIPVLRQVAALRDQLAAVNGGADWLRRHLQCSEEEFALQLAVARELVKTETAKATLASEMRAKKEGLLQKAKKEQERFASVGVGVPCSRCGQLVPAEHAERERGRVADEVRDLEEKLGVARTDEMDTLGAKKDAEDVRDLLATLAPLVARLTPVWRKRAASLDMVTVETLEEERVTLARSGVDEAMRKLELDHALHDEWVKQLAPVEAEITGIPADSRILVTDAKQQARDAERDAATAVTARDKAKDHADDLTRREKKYRELTGQIADAQNQADLHHRLDDLLGKGGLQRELVRTAEREIVRLANDTLQKLSDGDLSVELDDATDSTDEAFALRVRRADDPTPINVHYLSGSQKFRVAISVALAIGRFAAGQARPLESVIIDEGFGSLDGDGLRAAAAELNRLRQHLRRIVLVSHQEEFADRFPVIIRLAHGENGTVATAERK
jgi:DNA repair exonuclease SbcCD ATPase subunit